MLEQRQTVEEYADNTEGNLVEEEPELENIRTDIDELRTRFRAEIRELRNELKDETDEHVRTQCQEMVALKARLRQLESKVLGLTRNTPLVDHAEQARISPDKVGKLEALLKQQMDEFNNNTRIELSDAGREKFKELEGHQETQEAQLNAMQQKVQEQKELVKLQGEVFSSKYEEQKKLLQATQQKVEEQDRQLKQQAEQLRKHEKNIKILSNMAKNEADAKLGTSLSKAKDESACADRQKRIRDSLADIEE